MIERAETVGRTDHPGAGSGRVVVVGSANVDLTFFVDEFPRPGETLFGRGFDLGFGGKGANQAVAARYCGAEVEMVAKVGDDLFGPPTIENFEELGIGAEHVRVEPGASSGVAPIFVDGEGENRIIVVKGANDALRPEDVDRAVAAGVLDGADLLVLQLEVPLETVYHAIRVARERDVLSLLNPAPGRPLDMEVVREVDYLVPNESEAEAITGMPVSGPGEARRCGEHLLERGVRRVIVTLGRRGVLVVGPDGVEHVRPFAVDPVDTTGAGDAFIGCFAACLGREMADREAVRRASLYAALSTEAVGTQKSFRSWAELEAEWEERAGGVPDGGAGG